MVIVSFYENTIVGGSTVCQGQVANNLDDVLKTLNSFKYFASLYFSHFFKGGSTSGVHHVSLYNSYNRYNIINP